MLSGENSKVCLNLNFFFFQQQQQHSDSRVIGVYLLLSTHYPCSDTVAEVRWFFTYTPHLESCVQLWACYCERHLAPAESPVKGHKGDEGTWRRRGDLIYVCKYLKGGCKEDGARLFSVALWQDKRQWAWTETQKHIRFPPTFRKLFFFSYWHSLPREVVDSPVSLGDLEKLWCWPSLSRCPYLCRCYSDCVFPGTACPFWTFLCLGLWLCLPLPPSLRSHLHTFPGVEFLPSQTLPSALASGKPWSCRQRSRKKEHVCLESYQRRTGRTGRLKSFLAARKWGVERSQLMLL